jgi:DNA-directed RNA polymerase subunit RPC12/RpoP
MLIVSTSKHQILEKQSNKLAIFTAIFFFGGLFLSPLGIGLIMLPIGILGFIGLIIMPFILPKRIKSYNCPYCSTEIFWLADETEKGLNCPACQKRLLIQENKLTPI